MTAIRGSRFEELTLDAVAVGVYVADELVELTRTEYQLLELFMLNPGVSSSPP